MAQVVQRRAPVKAVFNLGMYATALAPAIGVYHLAAGDASLLSARGMTAMAVGVATFALVNLLLISQLLAVLEERPVWDVVRESSKLSILIFLGNSAVGLIAVVLWLREPVALPAVLLPAATLWLAYRSAERQMQERDRFQHLYEAGQAFASLAGAGGGAAQRPAQGGPAVRGRGGPSAVRPGRPAGRSGPSTAPRASASGRPTRPTWPPWPCSAPGPPSGPGRPGQAPRAGASCWSRPWSPRGGTWA